MVNRVRNGVGLGLLFVLAGAMWAVCSPVRNRAGSPAAVVSHPAPELAPKQARTVLPRPTSVRKNGADASKAARSPPPETRALPVTVTPPAPSPAPNNTDDASAPLLDRRPESERGDGNVAAAIQDNMEDVRGDIAGCITDWLTVEPSIEGRVSVGFRINADGLQEAWIVDHEDVPSGPLTCFATAVYAADWEGISDEPVEVTFPFVVASE